MFVQKINIQLLGGFSILAATLSIETAALASQGISPSHTPPCCCAEAKNKERRAFLKIVSGASFSQKINPSVDTPIWDPSPEGYNSRLGTAPIIGGGFGYHFFDFLSGDITLSYRWNYKYSKFQTNALPPTTPGALPSRTRKFDLDSTSLMFNARLHGRGVKGLYYAVDCAGSYIAPILGGGIGFTYHKVRNFHSQIAPTSLTTPSRGAVSIGTSSATRTSFTYQFEAGIEYKYKETWGLTTGYRWFDAGKFKTPNHIVGGTGLPGSPVVGVVVPPWTGRLRAHEVFAELSYYF